MPNKSKAFSRDQIERAWKKKGGRKGAGFFFCKKKDDDNHLVKEKRSGDSPVANAGGRGKKGTLSGSFRVWLEKETRRPKKKKKGYK